MGLKLHEKSKENWLLLSFGLLFVAGLLSFLFINTNTTYYNSRLKINTSLIILLIFSIVIAPVLEELTFRGFFTSKKPYLIISTILISLFVIFTYENYYSTILFFLFIISFFIYQKYKNENIFKISCILNALLFGIIHYQISDFQSFEVGYLVIFQISIGFLLTWITLNFGLLKSILFHSTYNSLILGFLLITIQFPNTTINKYEDQNITVVWRRIPYFESSSSNFSPTQNSLEAENTTINNFYKIFNIKESDIQNNEVIPLEPYMKYTFSIKLKETAINKNIKECSEAFFAKERLIYLPDSKN